MCAYCGCQALESVDQLILEHEALVNLVGQVHDAHRNGEVALMAELARQIAAVLGPHTAVEEQGLFPALAADLPGQVAALDADHRRIEAVLAEAAGPFLADPTWPRRLADVLGLLREHIREEQDRVFPAALAGLDIEQWEAVEAVRARVGTGLAQSAPSR
ncbi:hemerythrin domain-containing protein [Streptomyces fuscichromogenes]|uniref:hemerythrin domain-containing protein n=1 Tax=Streptomyces fuscichromogenes TaxID=1324013 RepID=UPI0037FA2B7E